MTAEQQIWKPHVTVAAICEQDNKFLLVKEEVDGKVVLNQPAGHLDPGETLEQAVIRETMEETSYPFTPQNLVGIYRFQPGADSDTYLRFAFSGIAGKNKNLPLDDGILSAQWMSLEEIQETKHLHRTPMVMQCIRDYLQNAPYPLQVISRLFA